MQSKVSAPLISRISVYLSGLCVIHCLATPVLIVMLPAMSTFFSTTIETMLVLSVLPLSAVGFVPTWKKHRNNRLMAYYLTGIAIMLGTHLGFHYTGLETLIVGHNHEGIHDHAHLGISLTESSLMILGATILAWAIWKNNRHTHSCKNPNHAH
jgi:hypothetical protein